MGRMGNKVRTYYREDVVIRFCVLYKGKPL